MRTRLLTWSIALAWGSSSALAQFVSGSDGSDGPFTPQVHREVDLSLAIPGDALMTPGTGDGVYDVTRWAVVFKYASIDIPDGVTVTFTNHPSRAPVVWLVDGDVIISGTIVYQLYVAPVHGEPTGASKLNTVFQTLFVLLTISQAWLGWPATLWLQLLGAAVLVTIAISVVQYVTTGFRRARVARA